MSHDLADVLKRDVPEPPRSLDPDAIIGVHRRRGQRRRTAAVVGSLVVAAIATPTAVLRADPSLDEASPADGPAAQVSALEQTEPVPAEWSEVHTYLPDAASRVATMGDDAAAYLWADGDDLCAVTLYDVTRSPVPGGGGGACTPAVALLSHGLVHVSDSSGPAGTERHLVVVVPDEYTEVTLGALTEPVTDNVAVFTWEYLADVTALSRSTNGLVLEGGGQPTATIPLP